MTGQFIGKKDISNHCSVWLKINIVDRGPKSLKTNDSWFENKDLLKFMGKE